MTDKPGSALGATEKPRRGRKGAKPAHVYDKGGKGKTGAKKASGKQGGTMLDQEIATIIADLWASSASSGEGEWAGLEPEWTVDLDTGTLSELIRHLDSVGLGYCDIEELMSLICFKLHRINKAARPDLHLVT